MHYFDNYGWYTSTPIEGRSTDVVPANTSETTTPGEMRANFTGYEWVDLPYQAPAPVIPPLPTLEDYDAALTAHLNAEAQTHRYEDRISCSVRAGYVGPFQAEGIAFAQWMDACNAMGYSMLAEFQQGLIPQPTISEMLAALPAMVWP